MKKPKAVLRFISLTLGLILVALMGWHFMGMKHHNHHGSHPALIPTEGFGSVGKFTLINQDGKKFGSADLKNHPWIGNFIFTRCAGPCPIMSAKMSRLAEDYKKHSELKFISFSVDPDYDSPEKLTTYAKTYGADHNRWHFLTGKRDSIYSLIRNQFHLAVKESEFIEGPEDPNQILHSLHFVLVDAQGGIQGYYNSNDAEALADLNVKVKNLLNNESTPSPHS